MTHPRLVVATALASTLITFGAAAQPAQVPIQGTLTDAGGVPLDGSHTIAIALYATQTGGSPVFEETQTVAVDRGAFTVYLGSASPLDLAIFDGAALFAGITVGADPEMSPRLALGSVPYAAFARETAALPRGAVMFFDPEPGDPAACPDGWSELVTARGRTLVGMPGGGTLRGTVGGALSNLENRTHTHGFTVPALDTNSASVAHTHNIPAHNHRWLASGGTFNTGGAPIPIPPFPFAAGAATFLAFGTTTTAYTELTTAAASGGMSANSTHSHQTVAEGGLVTGTAGVASVMPYLQLLACRKN